MIVCTIVINPSEADRLKVIKSLVPLIGSTRIQTGCRVCSLLFDAQDPLKLVLWEEWDTREHLERHLRSEDYRLVLAAIDLSQDAPEIHFDTVATRAGLEIVEAARTPGRAIQFPERHQ